MKITQNQNEAINDYQQSRGCVPFPGEDGFRYGENNAIEVTDQSLFLSTLESIIDICQDAIIDEIEVSKNKKWLKSILKLHEEITI